MDKVKEYFRGKKDVAIFEVSAMQKIVVKLLGIFIGYLQFRMHVNLRR